MLVALIVALVGGVVVASSGQSASAATTWTSIQAPSPADATPAGHAGAGQQIEDVTCPSTTWCVAVGTYNAGPSSDAVPDGLIDTWSNGAWTPTAEAIPGNMNNPVTNEPYLGGGLSSVSCPAVGSCVAIGGDVIETLSDRSWTGMQAPIPADVSWGSSGVTLGGVTCSSTASCVIFGQDYTYSVDPAQTRLFFDTLSNGTWTAADAPLPANASVSLYDEDILKSISCPAAGNCVAVGQYAYAPNEIAGLIDTLSNGSWTATEAPQPPSTAANQQNALVSVSCPTTAFCVAVGSYPVTGPDLSEPDIETLSGGTWVESEAPVPANVSSSSQVIGNQLDSVTCPATGSCEAVGNYTLASNSEPGPLLDTLANGTWTPLEGPLPGSGKYGSLADVSCPTMASCVAVGEYVIPANTGNSAAPLIETFGSGWTATSGPGGLYLSHVSCPASGTCVANGPDFIDTLNISSAAQQSTTTTASVSPGGPLTLGQSVQEMATVTGTGAGTPTGTVSFYQCGPTPIATPCTTTADPVGNAVPLGSGTGKSVTVTSPSFTPPSGGYWCLSAYYSGDTTNAPSSDPTSGGCVDVAQESSTTTVTTAETSVEQGQSITATVTVTGNADQGSPTGSVLLFVCQANPQPTPCTSQAQPLERFTALTPATGDSSVVTLPPYTTVAATYDCFTAYYTGDSNYVESSNVTSDSACVYVVSTAPPPPPPPPTATVTATPTTTTVALGQSTTITATVSGNPTAGTPTGNVQFYVCAPTGTPTVCTRTTGALGSPVPLVSSGPTTATATSASFTPTSGGYWCFAVEYPSGNYGFSYDTTADSCIDVPPQITSPDGLTLVAGVGQATPFSFVVSAAFGQVTYTEAGKLPPGITFMPGGAIFCTPWAKATGVYPLVITVTDAGGQLSATQNFVLTVQGGTQGPLAITNTSPLPQGQVGAGYSDTLSASPGASKEVWRVISGSLPRGLTLNKRSGIIAGTPKARGVGTHSFEVEVIEGKQSAVATLSVTVTD